MRITILIPCHNEEKSIQKCVESCLAQTRKPDEIIVVNDGSTDRSGEILATFGDAIRVVSIPKATGNKSYAQEHGLRYVTGDVFIATDGDTIIDKNFVAAIVEDFADPNIAAVSGYVKSLKYNWLTTCRAFEYSIGQNIHKLAQSYMNFMFVIPGAAGAFRTQVFKKYIKFEHDTITEDLDFTYKLHENNLPILYDRRAISYTQDPTTLMQYINQTRRWVGGGFQNLRKHIGAALHPVRALELSLIYIEGLIFSVALLVMPFINWLFTAYILGSFVAIQFLFALYAAYKERRLDVLWVPFIYILFTYISAYLFLEQFVKEIILKRKELVWFQPERVNI